MTKLLTPEEAANELAGRIPLSGEIKLRERESTLEAVLDRFEIEGIVHAGAGCICYMAVRHYDNGLQERGMLKEFYPVCVQNDAQRTYCFTRDKSNTNTNRQLYSSATTKQNFIRAKNEFFESYKKISSLVKEEGINENFYAPISIYRGIEREKDDNNFTLYIWTAKAGSVESFEDYLIEMHRRVDTTIRENCRNINLFLAKEMLMVLKTMRALAIGIHQLHLQNFLHLDIKPANFGISSIPKTNGDALNITLFDVNTVYSLSSPLPPESAGSYHFSSPELARTEKQFLPPIGLKSDIYSLGATLYNALILSKEGRSFYDESKFNDIDRDLSQSLFMQYSELNAKSDLFDCLSRLLKKSLARSAYALRLSGGNYLSVAEWIEDITIAHDILSQQILNAESAGATNKAILKIIDKEEHYHTQINGGAKSCMQRFLYDYPLYDYVGDGGSVSVLVLGAGVFAQNFIDTAFELSQIKNCYLDITVLSNEKEKDEARFLNARPAFKDFFYLNGQAPKYTEQSGGNYGSLRFQALKGKKSAFEKGIRNAALIKNSIEPSSRFSYVFISLADDELNRKLAEDLAVSSNILCDEKALIGYVSYDKIMQKEKEITTPPVTTTHPNLCVHSIGSSLDTHPDFSLLERMALGCHLLWEKGVNLDIHALLKNFSSPYSYSGSMANAISIKYKLHSIGIELKEYTDSENTLKKERTLRRLSKAFAEQLYPYKTNKNNNEFLNELVMFEHRRWVVNMICAKSNSALDESEFFALENGSNKIPAKKKHACIVPSLKEWSLNQKPWQDVTYWDRENLDSDDSFLKLDALDKKSVSLHRYYMQLANEFDWHSFEMHTQDITNALNDDPEVSEAWGAYVNAMKSLKADSDAKWRLKTSQDRFLQCLSRLEIKNTLSKKIELVQSMFAPVAAAYTYTDYKSIDQSLVRNIPFILNYNFHLHLCEPLLPGKEAVNTALALSLNPKDVTFLARADTVDSLDAIKTSLMKIGAIMDHHNLQSALHLVLFSSREKSCEKPEPLLLKEALSEACPRIATVIDFNVGEKPLEKAICSFLEENEDSPSCLSALAVHTPLLKAAVKELPDYSVPLYSFNIEKKEIFTEEFEWFTDNPFHTHFMLRDFLPESGAEASSLLSEKSCRSIFELFFIHHKKAFLYTKAWNVLCDMLHHQSKNCLFELPIAQQCEDISPESFYFPVTLQKKIESVLNAFSHSGIVHHYQCRRISAELLQISFSATAAVKEVFRSLAANVNFLCADVVFEESNHNLAAFSASLNCRFSLKTLYKCCDEDEALYLAAREILDYLIKNRFLLSQNSENANEICFLFSSYSHKYCLTHRRFLAKTYLYYIARESRSFDKIYLFNENRSLPDLLAIKGFRVIPIYLLSQQETPPKEKWSAFFEKTLYLSGDAAQSKSFEGAHILPIDNFINYLKHNKDEMR